MYKHEQFYLPPPLPIETIKYIKKVVFYILPIMITATSSFLKKFPLSPPHPTYLNIQVIIII